MAVISIPATATEQQNQRQTLSETGDVTLTRSFKDTYAHGQTWIGALANGDTLGNWVLSSAELARTPGDMGVISLRLVPKDTVVEGGEEAQIALDETWTLKAVRNDKSLLAYCGPSEGNDANRADIEAWLKEPDGTIARDWQYTKSDGSKATLTAASQELAEKFLSGHDSVMRFYPMLTKKRTYATEPETVYENLATIDTPSVSSVYASESAATGDRAKQVNKPGNIASIISGHSWLKCQDDLEQTADGKFVRVESWIGAKTGQESWDNDFYGATGRWPMPYVHS